MPLIAMKGINLVKQVLEFEMKGNITATIDP